MIGYVFVAGALAAGGIISLIKSLPLIIKTFGGAIKSVSGPSKNSGLRTERDLDIKFVIIAIIVLTLLGVLGSVTTSFPSSL